VGKVGSGRSSFPEPKTATVKNRHGKLSTKRESTIYPDDMHDAPPAEPWLIEVPSRALAKTARDDWESYIADSVAEGGLLQPATAARLLDVHKSRPFQLLDSGKLTRFEHFGHSWVSCREIKDRLLSPPPAGRPKKA
jgi:hypothetical protein